MTKSPTKFNYPSVHLSKFKTYTTLYFDQMLMSPSHIARVQIIFSKKIAIDSLQQEMWRLKLYENLINGHSWTFSWYQNQFIFKAECRRHRSMLYSLALGFALGGEYRYILSSSCNGMIWITFKGFILWRWAKIRLWNVPCPFGWLVRWFFHILQTHTF